MKLIPKYQGGTPKKGVQHESYQSYIPQQTTTFVPSGIYSITGQPYEEWKRETDLEAFRRAHDKNEQIGPAQNVPEDLREYYRRRAETQQWIDQRAKNFESFGNLLNLTLPSTYVGQAMGRQLTGPEALAIDLVTGPVLGGIKTVGKKGVQAATKLATRGAEAYRRRFIYPREGLPQWFYTQKPLIAGGTNNVIQTSEKDIHNTLMNVARKATILSQQGKLGKNQIKELTSKLSAYLSQDQAKQFVKRAEFFLKGDKTALAIEQKALKNVKGKKGQNDAINEAIQIEKAETPEGLYDNLLNSKNAQILDDNTRRTQQNYGSGINLNLFSGSMLAEDNIPKRVAVAKVDIPSINRKPEIKKIPIMERFYQNAVDQLLPLQNWLIKHKWLVPTEKGWYGRTKGSTELIPVNPEKYILSFYDPIRNSTNRVDFRRYMSQSGNGQWIDRTAWHGTPLGDKALLEQFRTTEDSPLFTTISDGMPGVEGVRRGYQGSGGTSIPILFKNRDLELRPISPMEGFNSSIGYVDSEGNTLGQLKNHFSIDARGKAAEVRRVSDAAYDKIGNTGQVQNEYIFGAGTPDVKFYFNTLDFIKGMPPYLKKGGNIVNNRFNRLKNK